MSIKSRIIDRINIYFFVKEHKKDIEYLCSGLLKEGIYNAKILKKINLVYPRGDYPKFFFSGFLGKQKVFIKLWAFSFDDEIKKCSKLTTLGVQIPPYLTSGKIDKYYYVVFPFLDKYNDIISLKRFFLTKNDLRKLCDWLLYNLELISKEHYYFADFTGNNFMYKKYKNEITFAFCDAGSFSIFDKAFDEFKYFNAIANNLKIIFKRRSGFLKTCDSYKVMLNYRGVVNETTI